MINNVFKNEIHPKAVSLESLLLELLEHCGNEIANLLRSLV